VPSRAHPLAQMISANWGINTCSLMTYIFKNNSLHVTSDKKLLLNCWIVNSIQELACCAELTMRILTWSNLPKHSLSLYYRLVSVLVNQRSIALSGCKMSTRVVNSQRLRGIHTHTLPPCLQISLRGQRSNDYWSHFKPLHSFSGVATDYTWNTCSWILSLHQSCHHEQFSLIGSCLPDTTCNLGSLAPPHLTFNIWFYT
jgi:hypothetical protein